MRIEPIRACFRALVAVVFAGVACAGGERQADGGFQGFMTLRPSAVNFGLTPGDTFMEVPPARAPEAVREDVEAEVRRIDYEPGCTRYFVSGSATVTFAAKHCDGTPPHVLDRIDALFDRRGTHEWGLVLFRQEGDRIVRDPREFNALMTVCPGNRDRFGTPSGPCP